MRGPLAAWPRRRKQTPALVPQPLTEGGPYTLLDCDAGEMWFDRADEVIRPYVERSGTWEAAEGRLLLSLARPGMRFLDVGANIGYFSLLIAKHAPGATIDAVEPEPGNARLLAMNLWHNEVEAAIWPLALSGGERSLPLQLTEHNAGDTRTHAARTRQWYETVAVAARGDDLFGARGFDLVKVDVQGFELDVLQGMPKTIDRSPGIAVVAEFWPKALRDRKVDPYTVLRSYREMGFTIVTQVEDQLRQIEDPEIIAICDEAGEWGQVNLLLRR